jgi:branched-chain amino acid transport system permease protein
MQRVDLRAQWPWLLLVAVVVALPLLGPRYWVFLATTAAINIVLMLSLGVVSGRAGMITLCQASFAAIGGWTVAWLQRSGLGLPFALELVLGGLAALPFGILLGLPALRLRGINLAVVTLAFASAMDILLARFSFPGVSAGQPVQRGELLAGEGLYFWFCAAIVVALIAALSWADRHRIGSAWLAVGA